MSTLNNILSQISQNKKEIVINKEKIKLKDPVNSLVYFATVQPNEGCCERKLNSFKIFKFDRAIKNVSRDLMEKFRIVNFNGPEQKLIIKSTLLSNGFVHNDILIKDLLKILYVFKAYAKIKKFSNGNFLK